MSQTNFVPPRHTANVNKLFIPKNVEQIIEYQKSRNDFEKKEAEKREKDLLEKKEKELKEKEIIEKQKNIESEEVAVEQVIVSKNKKKK